MLHKKVRFASSAPGLLLLVAGAIAGCDAAPEGKPAAEVDLLDADAPAPVVATDTVPTAPGFDSVGETLSSAPKATGEQLVSGSIVDFLCDPDTPTSSQDTAPPAACELIIRSESRGDRRMLCDVAPCDAWAARGGLPQGIRGLKAEAEISLIDTFDAGGNPAGRVAKVVRLSVAYTKQTQ